MTDAHVHDYLPKSAGLSLPERNIVAVPGGVSGLASVLDLVGPSRIAEIPVRSHLGVGGFPSQEDGRIIGRHFIDLSSRDGPRPEDDGVIREVKQEGLFDPLFLGQLSKGPLSLDQTLESSTAGLAFSDWRKEEGADKDEP
jgi:hypothetical protein